ncbi:Scr1 family TA system antitoxin-like transcriptional regulator [Actinokineospora iranica]|uniref:Scr1 family TA system antitoxin-like transcriptional regulator n=1 Tax=Actinokineospora iranica TaxID=1271860 RepID=UPI001587E9C9|nr:Scr1 family TA system antitoxin-like transcriptional regulator [Actinokineospora iranica]
MVGSSSSTRCGAGSAHRTHSSVARSRSPPDSALPGIANPLDFVYVEQYDDARYLDDHDRVEAYEQLWGYLQAAALGPLDSIEFIGTAADQYS